MSSKNYYPSFANEIFTNVDFGEKIKTCMQCGVCAGSCPLSLVMGTSPRKIFAMIRAGKRMEVFESKSLLMCTSCYSCKVRCPRKIPVVDVMHGLAHYAIKNGFSSMPKTLAWGKAFWDEVFSKGRVDEKFLSLRYFFADGIIPGIQNTLNMADMGIVLFLHNRMKPLPEKSISAIKDLRKMINRARKIGKGGTKTV